MDMLEVVLSHTQAPDFEDIIFCYVTNNVRVRINPCSWLHKYRLVGW